MADENNEHDAPTLDFPADADASAAVIAETPEESPAEETPADTAERRVFLTDPMLATGGSASAAIKLLKDAGAQSIKLMTILSAPEGIAVIGRDHPDVEIVTAAVDPRLNDHGYIVPGLGDAGDRIYGTK